MLGKIANMISTEINLRVRYQETDQMGVVYHGNYFTWFEVARIELLDRIECRYLDLEKEGFRLPVITCDAQFLKPAHFDDRLIIRALVKAAPRVRIDIYYEVVRESILLARGHTCHAFTNCSGTLVRPPKKFLQAIANAL